MNKRELALQAVREASRLRTAHKIPPTEGLCPFDLGRTLGISMRMVSIPSLEGMYSPDPTLAIVIGSERPIARRRYTCGHELGHHVFGHGYRIDELEEKNSDPTSPEEYLAQRFSAALLMPKILIDATFTKRGWKVSDLVPEQFFIVAQELGVGYGTLITNLEINTNQLTRANATKLRQVALPEIRKSVAGYAVAFDVFHLTGPCARPKLDVEIGDILIFPNVKIDGPSIQQASQAGHYTAINAGICKVSFSSGGITEVRVGRRGFIGLAHFRYLEEVTDE